MPVSASYAQVRSLDGALDWLVEEADALGFDAIDYAYMPRARRMDGGWHAPDILSRKFPPHWQRGWRAFASDDPYLHSSYARNLPLDWNEVKGAKWLSRTQRDAITFISRMGFGDGVTVPIHLGDGGFAFVSGVSHARVGRWRACMADSTESLFLLAHRFHAAVASHLSGPSGRAPLQLTRREREVLAHAAAGRSAPATAVAMCRALETVRRQRKAAMAKLGAHTITAAVARAIDLGLL